MRLRRATDRQQVLGQAGRGFALEHEHPGPGRELEAAPVPRLRFVRIAPHRGVSIPVDLARLGTAVAERGGSAYLLTVSDQGTPHAVHVSVRLEGEQLIADVGKRSAANAAARSSVSVLFPARGDGDYSLIVDGVAAVAANGEERRVRVTPAKAVLHRPAVAPDPASTCAGDCVPLVASLSRRS